MSDYTKIRFFAIPATVTALERAAAIEGLSRQDILNRAVQLYALYVDGREAGNRLAEILPDGSIESLTLD